MVPCEYILEQLYKCYDLGQSPSNYFDYGQINNLASSRNEDIRSSLAKALVNHKVIDDAVKWLSQLAKDSDALVRVEAVDSLRTFVCRQSFDALCQATVDSDALVRGYAAYGVAIIGKEISFDEAKIILLSMVACENNPRVLVDIYEGLYVLGETTALKDLFSLIHIDDYLVQCAVIHACEEIANDRNKQIILSFLSRDIPFDNAVVKSACQNAIENIAEQEQ